MAEDTPAMQRRLATIEARLDALEGIEDRLEELEDTLEELIPLVAAWLVAEADAILQRAADEGGW